MSKGSGLNVRYLRDIKIANRRFQYLAKYVKGNKILDVGCQDANILNFIKKSVDYTGINRAENKELRKDGVNFVVMDVCKKKIPFPDKTFDTVIMGEIIEHLENPIFALKEVKRVLKSGGTLVGSTANAFNLQNFLISSFSKAGGGDHIYAFREEELENLLRTAGFKKVKVEKICSRIPLTEINLPDRGIFKILSAFYLFICKKS